MYNRPAFWPKNTNTVFCNLKSYAGEDIARSRSKIGGEWRGLEDCAGILPTGANAREFTIYRTNAFNGYNPPVLVHRLSPG